MQAIILAAGFGKRLKELTYDNTKCMVKVNGITLIERMLGFLDECELSKIIIVIGYKGDKLKSFISTLKIKTPIQFVDNKVYYKTNNIYSLFLAKEFLLQEDTILLESDLIFEKKILEKIISDSYPSVALVAKYESWMDGTVVTIDDENNIRSFLDKKQFNFENIKEYYKTVNVYKFSKEFSNSHYVPFLEAYCKALGNNEYYEQVLKVITLLDKPEIKASVLKTGNWYEIDDLQDLDIAESLFTNSADEKMLKIQKRFGGYWRYPNLIDFCYLVNPFYPPKKLLEEIKANFDRLISEYPSGNQINSLLIAKYFSIRPDCVVVGNGVSELIKSLFNYIIGRIGISIPTFEEYPNRIENNRIEVFKPQNRNYSYGVRDLISFYNEKKISALLLINPDNPSGNFINRSDVLDLLEWSRTKNIILIIDESFIDFIESNQTESLLNQKILDDFENLIIVKSISKSYGVAGLRLGFIASGNASFMNWLKSDVAIWNINSFAEFYLQICEKYKTDFDNSIIEFREVRSKFFKGLSEINNLRVIPSQANYFLCELEGGNKATFVANELLKNHNLLIKDLTNKNGIKGEFIRIAVKKETENNKLIDSLNRILTNDNL